MVIVIIFICFCFFFSLKYRRENWNWIENVSMLNGETIWVHHHYSHRALYGFPHNEFGGGHPRYEIFFYYKNIKYSWKCLFVPIVIQYWNKNFYIVMFDSEELENEKLRFYIYKNGLKEISRLEFPKQIAIQNRWIKKLVAGYKHDLPFETYIINPEDKTFRASPTAKIWVILEKGSNLREIMFNEIDEKYLSEYKQKFIDPVWGENL